MQNLGSVFLLPHFLSVILLLIHKAECLDVDKNNGTVIAEFPQDNAHSEESDDEEHSFSDSAELLPCADLRGYAFHNDTKKCWPVGEKGPCSDLMRFLADPNHEGYGDCDCIPMRNCIGRPRSYWPQTDRCYFMYSRGPCPTGQWLEFNESSKPECRPNVCGKQVKATKSKEFLFSHEEKCYKTGSQGFCNEGELVYVSSSDLAPRCFTTKPVCRFLIFTAQTLSCRTGSKLDVTGQCHHMREMDE